MKNEINDQLLARYFAGDASESELQEMDLWLDQDSENRKELKTYYSIWLKTQKNKDFANTDQAWKLVAKKILPKNQNVGFLRWAALLALIGTVSFMIWKSNTSSATYVPLISDKSTISKTLEDGSVITLNSFSLIEIPEKFTSKERRVKLIGEAFFDISPDPDKPFIIEANGTEVKVLGTSFGINARNENVKVSVKSGKVQFSSARGAHIIVVKDQEAEFDAIQDTIKSRFILDPNVFAYKTRVFEFKERPLKEVVSTLNKGYNANIQLIGNNFENYILSTRFDNESLDNVLQIVAETFDLQIKKEENSYIISKKPHIQ